MARPPVLRDCADARPRPPRRRSRRRRTAGARLTAWPRAGCRGGRDRDRGRVAVRRTRSPLRSLAPAAAAAVAAALAVAALPRAGLGRARAARRRRPGGSAAAPAPPWCILCAGLLPVILLPRSPTTWPLSAAAPALGVLGLAGAWPAIAARAASPWRRAVLGITGWVWLAVASALADADLLRATGPLRTPAASAWMPSLQQAVDHVLVPLASTEFVLCALVWGVAARGASTARGAPPILGGAGAGHGLVGDGCVRDRYIPRCQPLSRRWNACHRGARRNRRRDRRACAGGPQKLA